MGFTVTERSGEPVVSFVVCRWFLVKLRSISGNFGLEEQVWAGVEDENPDADFDGMVLENE